MVNILVMVSLSFAYSVLAQVFGLPQSGLGFLIPFCVIFGFGGAFISLLISKWMAKRMMGVQVIDPRTSDPQGRWLIDRVHEYSRAAGLTKMPEVGVYNSQEVNAFATGPSKSDSLVAVSAGLLSRMSKEEAEGVLAHEVAHIANGDMVAMTLIQGVINTIVLLLARIAANIVSSSLNKDDDRPNPFIYMGIVFLFETVFSLLGMVVVNYFSRAREYRADAGGARFAGREKMINALRRLQNTTQLIEPEQETLATLKIAGKKKSALRFLFATHPPLEERIHALERARI
ncbi:MAG: protease HtpX, partial [Bdellovibrionota bacterium]